MRKFLILSLITISVMMLAGCGSSNKKENQGENNVRENASNIEINNCKDCVFAFYTEEKNYGDNGSILSEYTKDYTTLKDENENQRKIFLGHMLDKDGKILRGFVCGIVKDKVFCLDGSKDGSMIESNKEILKKIFGEEKCSDSPELVDSPDIVCEDFNTYAYASGVVGNQGYCSVDFNGKMFCK